MMADYLVINIPEIYLITPANSASYRVESVRPALVAEWAKPPAAVHAGQGSLPIRVEA